MHLKMAARKSDLARMQLQTVAKYIKEKTNYSLELIYRQSFGDLNLDIDLAGAENKGLFTQDFYQALLDKEIDIVVHSWKDLPIENKKTTIVMTLPRKDCRDLLLIKKTSLAKIEQTKKISIMTSSPRREFFLRQHLIKLFPVRFSSLSFETVRGNIPTRLSKLMKSSSDGLVIAKAAVDRMLETQSDEFLEVRKEINGVLDQCQWMLLPLSLFPSAAGQGALALEVLKGSEIEKKLSTLNFQSDFDSVVLERKKLKELGGGCHSRLGVNYLPRPYGTVHYLSQEVNDHLVSRSELLNSLPFKKISTDKIWPQSDSIESTRSFRPVDNKKLQSYPGLWVSRSLALPKNYKPESSQKIWTSGVTSWQKLAERGVWVHGCADSLGEQENMRLTQLLPKGFQWVKLSHSKGVSSGYPIVATYDVQWKLKPASFAGKTHFFWMSGRLFESALQLCPEILKGQHFCGPGHTFDILKKYLPAQNLHIALGFQEWKKEITL